MHITGRHRHQASVLAFVMCRSMSSKLSVSCCNNPPARSACTTLHCSACKCRTHHTATHLPRLPSVKHHVLQQLSTTPPRLLHLKHCSGSQATFVERTPAMLECCKELRVYVHDCVNGLYLSASQVSNGNWGFLPPLWHLESILWDLTPAHAMASALALRPCVCHEAVHLPLIQPCIGGSATLGFVSSLCISKCQLHKMATVLPLYVDAQGSELAASGER